MGIFIIYSICIGFLAVALLIYVVHGSTMMICFYIMLCIVCISVPVLKVCNQGLCSQNTKICFLFSLSYHGLSFFWLFLYLSVGNCLYIGQGSLMVGNRSRWNCLVAFTVVFNTILF